MKEIFDKGVSNPVNRRHELMTRMSGFEQIAKDNGHSAIFVTLTCPSKYHNSYASSGHRNVNWNGATPYEANQYLNHVWQRIRASLGRERIQIYGFRIAEPQHDGTPHWHLLLFLESQNLEKLKEIMRFYALLEDGGESGASKYRIDFVDIDHKKGSATGYVAKYVSKNIDGKQLDQYIDGGDPIVAAQRVEAWASMWGIRQFQQLGGVSVTVYRELRRLKKIPEIDNQFSSLFNAADQGKWGSFVLLMGGVFVKRKDQTLRPYYSETVNNETGEVKQSWLNGNVLIKLKGLFYKGREIITRYHEWTIEFRFEKAEAAFSSLLGVL